MLWLLPALLAAQLNTPAPPAPQLAGPVEPTLTAEDRELLDRGRKIRDYPCNIRVSDPVLGFDFRFHTAFRATIPLKKLDEDEDRMTLLYRVRSRDLETEPLHFRLTTEVPRREEPGRSSLLFRGSFATGEGEYVLDMAIIGETGNKCTQRFEFKSRRSRRGREAPLTLRSGEIAWPDRDVGRVWPRRDADRALRFKVLVNVPPFRNSRRTLTANDVAYLLNFLKYFGERTPLSDVSVVAFNLKEQEVFYRQPFRPWLSLVDLGNSMDAVENRQVIAVSALQKDGVHEFLRGLIREEVAGSDVDGVLFLGPLGFHGESLKDLARELEGNLPSLFYFRYRFHPAIPTFGDPLRDFVREADGTTFEIADAYELWEAVEDVVEELVAGG